MGKITGGLFFLFKVRLWFSLISIGLVLISIVGGILKADADIRARAKQKIINQEIAARNFEQYTLAEINACAVHKAHRKAKPLGITACKCIVGKRLAHTPLAVGKGFDAHMAKAPVTAARFLTIPPAILTDLYMSGEFADKITELDLDDPAKFPAKTAQNLELYMMRAAAKPCLDAKSLSNWSTYSKLKPRTRVLQTTIRNINAVTKKRNEMLRDGRIAGLD